MGGLGSGRWYRSDKRSVVEDYRRIDVRHLDRTGGLRPGLTYSLLWENESSETTASLDVTTQDDRLTWLYRYRWHGVQEQEVEDAVLLDWTPCTYGGSRPWFLCPHCGRRCAVLHGAGRFLGRLCYRLPYASQNETLDDRLLRKAQKLRARIGAPPSLDAPIARPKGMHRGTYARIRRRILHLEEAVWTIGGLKFGIYR